MTKYLLDTNIVSALMDDPRGPIMRRIAAIGEDSICTSVIVFAEIKYGIYKKQSQRLAKQFAAIAPTLAVIPFEEPADEHYARIRADTERVGISVGQNDMLIAAQAQTLGAVLVSADRIFGRMPGVNVENWLRQ